jgi:archaellum component FlaC
MSLFPKPFSKVDKLRVESTNRRRQISNQIENIKCNIQGLIKTIHNLPSHEMLQEDVEIIKLECSLLGRQIGPLSATILQFLHPDDPLPEELTHIISNDTEQQPPIPKPSL